MKKIIVIIVILLLFSFKVTAIKANNTNILKKLYILEGSTDTLTYPGFELIETDVIHNKPGLYTAKYKEDITNRIFSREIEIISKNQLLETGIKNVNLLEEQEFEDKKLLKRLNSSEIETYIFESNDTLSLAYLYYDGMVTFEELDTNKYLFIDAVFDEEINCLYLVCNIFQESTNIYVALYSLTGEKLCETTLSGSKVDIVEAISLDSRNLYLSGYTTSNDLDFNHTSYQEDSFIISLDKQTLEINDYLDLKEEGIDYISSSLYLDYLYVVKHYYIQNLHVVKIIKLDENLNIIDETFLGTISMISDISLRSFNNEIYYFCHQFDEEYNDNVTSLYRIKPDLQVQMIDQYYDEFAVGKDLNIVNGEISLLYTTYNSKENYPTYIRIVGDNNKKINLDNRIYDNLYFNGDGNLDLIYENKLKCYEYVYVYAVTIGDLLSANNVHPKIVCNNVQKEYNAFLSNTFFDPNLFGEYQLTYYYNFEFFDLAIKKNIIVDSGVKVENNNIYTTNLCLKFNGTATLNNMIIETGHVIDKPGEYVLNVKGVNGIEELYYFEVVKEFDYKTNTTLPVCQIEITFDNEPKEDNLAINATEPLNYLTDEDYTDNLWYIIIPITSLIICVCTFTLIGRKLR